MANGGSTNGVNGANGVSNFNGAAAAALEKGVPIGVAMSGDGELNYRNNHRETSQKDDGASVASGAQQYGGRTETGLPDFFSQEIFNVVLHNPTTSHQLRKFSQSRFCGENMEFLEKVDKYNTLLDDLTKVMADIYQNFTAPGANHPLNIATALTKRMNQDIKATQLNTIPALELIFADAQACTETILATDIYPRFVKHQMAVSASRALSHNREKYAGLGDCFCLTDPAIADLPIVAASDGFVRVTGYSRAEIIPRNCRFLQGKYTDQAAARRIRDAIEQEKECVELLLNYKKNGVPFWNLLYCAPLFDKHGKLKFFLGGQINVSHTVHTRTDILRVLSAAEDADDAPTELGLTPAKLPPPKPARRRLFRFNRTPSNSGAEGNAGANGAAQDTGMEKGLLNKIEKMSFRSQMQAFYAAYSKYLILSASLVIDFFSPDVVDMLLIDPAVDTAFVGSDIFKTLASYSPTLPKTAFRERVRASVLAGRAISIDLQLSTRRSMMMRGNEQFVTHWTPMKDEHQALRSVVVCFAPIER